MNRRSGEEFVVKIRNHLLAAAVLGGLMAVGSEVLPLVPYPATVRVGTGVSTAPVAVGHDATLGEEAYRLDVRPDGIAIACSTSSGEFYARQTLRQLKRPDGTYPCVFIEDSPRFRWRGAHLDESRHFFGKEVVKRILDRMAAFKLNVFHWHLVDSHGWRVPVPGYPDLTVRGAVRPRPDWDPNVRDGEAGGEYGPFAYTRRDLEEIVAYAAARHIRIVPEIEIPGHSRAVVLCYPSFSCLDQETFMDMIRRVPEVDRAAALCLGNDEVIRFLEAVLDEICDIFPGTVIHIGGDECLRDNWKGCPKCQARMTALGLGSESELQAWATRHFTGYLAAKGRRAMGWDEILDGGLAEGALVMSWRGTEGGIAAAKAGHEVVMCPHEKCYLDYPTGEPDDACPYPGFCRNARLPLEKVYSLDPLEGIPESQRKFIIGTQSLNWTESTWCESDLFYKMWPRTCANAEIAWTGAKVRSFADFKARLGKCAKTFACCDDLRPQRAIVIENARFRLELGDDAVVKSLILKPSGEECVAGRDSVPLFSVTQDRPFNNEVKLVYPNKRTTYPANALKREGDHLIVGFKTAPYEAIVDLKVTDSYVEFRLADFLVDKEDYDYLKMDVPPVASFRVLQLPILDRKNFGDWLNASWDEKSAIGVVGTSPYADIDHEERCGFRILSADLVRGRKLKGASAALIAARGREDFLDCMDALEGDFDLPRGVRSRRSDCVNAFIYHVAGEVSPANIERHIWWAKRGGFEYMTFSTCEICKDVWSWGLNGDYDWSEKLPAGAADMRAMLAKVRAAGIHPGLHFYSPHIGLKSRYVTPVADPRLHKTRLFTLAKSIDDSTNITEITVFEPTEDVTMCEPCRVLQFGGELFSYESYTREHPYRFLGVRRGAMNTRIISHPRGEIGGVLDISEFGAPMSCYLDQDTDLQDEVAAKVAAIYACGFEYAYFDGSEGVNAPYNFHVSNAQYRQWKQLEPKPLFSEGAAKTHFGWHILSGANAFDCFPPETFKRNIIKFPVAQAPLSWQDMTRVNFGWWKFFAKGKEDWWGNVSEGTTPDQWQFACSQCLAWGCPATVLVDLADVEADRENAEACFEVMRRWEFARKQGLLSEEQRRMLRDVSHEYNLSLSEDGLAILTERMREDSE